jgi:small subunit ribosomal protein S6
MAPYSGTAYPIPLFPFYGRKRCFSSLYRQSHPSLRGLCQAETRKLPETGAGAGGFPGKVRFAAAGRGRERRRQIKFEAERIHLLPWCACKFPCRRIHVRIRCTAGVLRRVLTRGTTRRKGNALRTYEALYIVIPELEDDGVQTVARDVENLVTQNGGSIVRSEIWGKRKLAYEVKKHTEGYYILLRFEADADFIARLENYFRLSEAIFRFLIVHFDEHTLRLEAEQEIRREEDVRRSSSSGRAGRDDDDDDEKEDEKRIRASSRRRRRDDDDDDQDDDDE